MGWRPLPHEAQLYRRLFEPLAEGDGATLPGPACAALLLQYDIPGGEARSVLRAIWAFADRGEKGALRFAEFCVAMRLVQLVQAGYAPDAASFCGQASVQLPGG